MTNSTLGYFRTSPLAAPRRRPVPLTVVAWVGIVICGAIVLSGITGLTAGPDRQLPESIFRMDRPSAALFGFVLGFLARWSTYILMLAACIGLLSVRPGAWWLAVVTAYVFMAFSVIEMIVLWSALNPTPPQPQFRGGGPTPMRAIEPNELFWIIVITAAIGFVFPIYVIAALRSQRVSEAFRAAPMPKASPPEPMTPLAKGAAVVLLVFASVLLLVELMGVRHWSKDPQGYRGDVHQYALAGIPGTALPMLLLLIVLHALMVVGAILALLEGRTARGLIIAACLAAITIESARAVVLTAVQGINRQPPKMDALIWLMERARPLTYAMRSVFPYVILVLVFLRPPPRVDNEPADAELLP